MKTDLCVDRCLFALVLLGGLLPFSIELSVAEQTAKARSHAGLQVFYDFGEIEGSLVHDRVGGVHALDLKIENLGAVTRAAGTLTVIGNSIIRSEKPAKRLNAAIKRSGELTIEAWVTAAKTDQNGPARIISLSRNGSERNVTLGQDGAKFDVRLRSTKTNTNGIPSVSAPDGSLTMEPTHVVYTRNRGGTARVYLNGEEVTKGKVAGSLSNWASSYTLALGNEHSKDRVWLGSYHLVAIFSRDLSSAEVRRHFNAGPDAEGVSPAPDIPAVDPKVTHFEQKIAPLLANHCLECHDAVTNEGELDFSRKLTAFKGNDEGPVLVAGSLEDSLLWESVESDDMPKNRTSLTDEEKQWVRQWIEDGAVWSKETIDPADYAHGNTSDVWVQRLTLPEYVATVRATVGVDIAKEARELLPPELRADGFSNTAYNLNVDLKRVEAYGRLAEIIVQRMDVKAFADRFEKNRKFTDDDMGKLISKMGKWMLRGPVEEREIIAYRGISTTVASAGGSYDEAVGYIIGAMLQSPRFLYRVEIQRGNGEAFPAGEYELAARISYILWGGPPDRKLLAAAEDGELYDPEATKEQIDRMLKDPRAVERSLLFASEWLNLGRLGNLRPNSEKFPDWDPALAADMREESLAFFKHVVWEQKRPMADLLNAQATFLTPRLARHYGLEVVEVDETSSNLTQYDLTSVPERGGLLTQGSALTVGGDEASMVSRGLFIFHDLLRAVVKDPPPGTDTTSVPTKPGLTQRMVAETRLADQSCSGCHSKFEPFAFGLEKFDGLGAFHELDEHGNALREDGQILFPGDPNPIAFKTSAELMELLARSERVQQNITWKLAQFALGRPLGGNDATTLGEIHQTAKTQGGTYAATVTAIILSDLVQLTRTELAQQ
ncbi:MAG: hypothetical protein ACI9R3_000448 [Verrucomicrobiales bacterium]|jgi:hypothetical protein